MRNDSPPTRREILDEPPPFLRSWPRVYTLVLICLVAVIALLYAGSRAFAP